jgi:hypothetical protein
MPVLISATWNSKFALAVKSLEPTGAHIFNDRARQHCDNVDYGGRHAGAAPYSSERHVMTLTIGPLLMLHLAVRPQSHEDLCLRSALDEGTATRALDALVSDEKAYESSFARFADWGFGVLF